MGRKIACFFILCTFATTAVVLTVHANNAKDLYLAELRARSVVLEFYQPSGGQEYRLLDALVKSGPFEKGPIGGLVNERILQVPSSDGVGTSGYFVLGRYFDSATAQQVSRERASETRPFLSGPPLTLQLTVVEHLLANWGWERRSGTKIEQVGKRQLDALLENKLSISFLKVGYVGQVATLRFFPSSSTLKQVIAKAQTDPGLMGASVFQDKTHNQYVLYSEFFQAPKEKAGEPVSRLMAGRVLDHQPTIVVENYEPR